MTKKIPKQIPTPFFPRIKKLFLDHPGYPLNLLAIIFLFGLILVPLIPPLDSLGFFQKTRHTLLISGGLALPVTLFFYLLALFPRVNLLPFWSGLPPIILALFLLATGFHFLPALALGSIGFAGLDIYPRLAGFLEKLNEHPSFLASRVVDLSPTTRFFRITLPASLSPLIKSFIRIFLCILTVETTVSFLGIVPSFLPTWGTALNNAYLHSNWPNNWWSFLWPGLLFLLTALACSLLTEGGKKDAH